jgi:hypothetical protein
MYALGKVDIESGFAGRIIVLLEVVACFLFAWSCALAGAITGWKGMRHSGTSTRGARAALVLNSILFLGIPLWTLYLINTGYYDHL